MSAAGRIEMHWKIDISCNRTGVKGPEVDHLHFRISWAGHSNYIGIQLAGVPANRTIPHVEPAIEGQILLNAGAVQRANRFQFASRRAHGSRYFRR
jgi:hypothetical protein